MTGRATISRIGTIAALSVLIGAVGALLWANLAVLPSYVVQSDGHAVISELDLAQVFSSTFWFSVLGLVGGLAVGVATWAALRTLGWPVAVLTAAFALLSGGACWLLGELVGPSSFASRMAGAKPGESVRTALHLDSPSALALWVFAAMAVPLFAASLGPEVDGRPNTRRRRLRPTEAVEQPADEEGKYADHE